MEEEIGTVISINETPNTYGYSFVIDKKNCNKVKKNIYVYTRNEQGLVLGFLDDVQRANRYLENAEAISDYGAETLARHFPINRWDYLVSNVSVLGCAKKNGEKFSYERSTLPSIPGQPVFIASNEMLREFFGVDEKGMDLGKVFGHDVDLKVNLNRMFQKHAAILAMSGAGKSNLTRVILEEITERKAGKISALVFDIHGEYSGLSSLGREKVKIINGKDIKIPASALSAQMFRELFPEISSAGYGDFAKFIKYNNFSNLEKLKQSLQESAIIKDNVKGPLLRYIEELDDYKIIDEHEKPNLQEFMKPGVVVILNLSDISETKKLQMIAYYLLKKIFHMRRTSAREGKKIIPPSVVFIEEAHNFAPKDFHSEMAMAKWQIEKIAREGRKFNLGLCLITQRPSHLSQTALSQCNTQIILRITNPNDHMFIQDTSESIDSKTIRNIASLSVGEGIIIGEAVNAPVFVKFRKARSSETKLSKSMEEEANDFEKNEEEIADAYL